MNRFPISLLILAFGLTMMACEKVIDVDLNEADRQLVIEAQLEEGEHVFEVYVTETGPYFSAGEQPIIRDAVVRLTDDQGLDELIPVNDDGFYTATIRAQAGRTYTLMVEIQGEVYQATSFLPSQVVLEDLLPEFQEARGPIEEGYLLYFYYNDPPNVPNFYRAVHRINGVAQLTGEDLQVVNDNINDGSYTRFPLFGQIFDPGDTVEVELIHFDEASYDYFSSLGDIIDTGGGPNSGSAAPANPVTNWRGPADILGYFTAYSSSK
ncbi:MAG: DUF4249 domain-containing protein, partial [Bacteroidota bacterium]